MPVIYLDKHRHLTEKQKKMAEVALSNGMCTDGISEKSKGG